MRGVAVHVEQSRGLEERERGRQHHDHTRRDLV